MSTDKPIAPPVETDGADTSRDREEPDDASLRSDEERRAEPNRETRSDSTGKYSIIVIFLVVFGCIFLLNAWCQPPRYEIPIVMLTRLIERGNPLAPGTSRAKTGPVDEPAAENDPAQEAPGHSDTEIPHIVVEEGTGKKLKKVRYSCLDEIVIGPYEVTGKVRRFVLEASDKTKEGKETEVPFYSGRQGLTFVDNELFALFRDNGFENVSARGKPGIMERYGTGIVTGLILLAFLVFMVQRLGTGAMAFGHGRDIQVSPEDIHVSFDDVAGVEEAVEELREIVDFLRRPERYQLLGGHIPKGVLLVGPPGTGKTLIAKAVAGEAGVPFFCLSGSDFVELYAGVGAARVRDLFQQAQRSSPCIIFIDELDALGKARSGQSFGAHDEREQTLNALLVEMDGFGTNSGTIVMAATNRPEILDSALLRSGRFDRQVLVDRPDLTGREDILKIHSKQIKLDKSINLRQIASMTSGFVGADLAALVNEAALLAARAGKDSVTMEEFTEGVERVTTGLQKKRRIMTDSEKRRVSYHECGHALVACLLPNSDPVHKVSIIPRGMAALGYTLQRPDDERFLMTQKELETRIQTLLAGIIAEEIVFTDISTGAQSDLERATEIARSMVMTFGMSRLGHVNFRASGKAMYVNEDACISNRLHSEQTAWKIDQEVEAIIENLYVRTMELLSARRETLDRLAERLLEKEVIDTDELNSIIEPAEPRATEIDP